MDGPINYFEVDARQPGRVLKPAIAGIGKSCARNLNRGSRAVVGQWLQL